MSSVSGTSCCLVTLGQVGDAGEMPDFETKDFEEEAQAARKQAGVLLNLIAELQQAKPDEMAGLRKKVRTAASRLYGSAQQIVGVVGQPEKI
jgi:hypothetical protein